MKIDFTDYISGAAIATDLINTSAAVRGAGEALADADSVRRFLERHALAAPDDVREHDIQQVWELRTKLRRLLECDDVSAIADGGNAMIARGVIGPQWNVADGRWYIETRSDVPLAEQLAALVGFGLLGTLHTLGPRRYRHCTSPTCDGMFIDTSKAGKRRYCMPDVCGNRLNVAKYRARQHARDAEAP